MSPTQPLPTHSAMSIVTPGFPIEYRSSLLRINTSTLIEAFFADFVINMHEVTNDKFHVCFISRYSVSFQVSRTWVSPLIIDGNVWSLVVTCGQFLCVTLSMNLSCTRQLFLSSTTTNFVISCRHVKLTRDSRESPMYDVVTEFLLATSRVDANHFLIRRPSRSL